MSANTPRACADGKLIDDDDLFLPSPRPLAGQRSAPLASGAPQQGLGPRSASVSGKPAASNKWDDDIDDDFDVDALLPDNESARPPKSSAASAASVHFSPDTFSSRSAALGSSSARGRVSPETDSLISPALPSNAAATASATEPENSTRLQVAPVPDTEKEESGEPALALQQQAESRSSSLSLSVRPATTGGSGGHPREGLSKEGSGNGDDDIDIGFMPSFLDPDREPPRGRR